MLNSTALDKLALAALRQADTISFHHTDGKSLIRATKEHQPNEPDPFAPRETTITGLPAIRGDGATRVG